jgi:hypothetical protein
VTVATSKGKTAVATSKVKTTVATRGATIAEEEEIWRSVEGRMAAV